MEPVHSPGKRVLVIDDEAKFGCVVAGFLMGRGYKTKVASNAEEALAQVEEFEPEILNFEPESNEWFMKILIRVCLKL